MSDSSDSSDSKDKQDVSGQLRRDAELGLKTGSAPPAISAPVSVDALTLLHKLASSPESAADAHKLLHELQVHQVEIDLQHRQLEANERELADSLTRYKILFEYAPVGYLVVDFDGNIIEANRLGAELFGFGTDAILGHSVVGFMAQDDQPILSELIDKQRTGGSAASCVAEMASGSGAQGMLGITASTPPGGECVLLVLTRRDPEQAAD